MQNHIGKAVFVDEAGVKETIRLLIPIAERFNEIKTIIEAANLGDFDQEMFEKIIREGFYWIDPIIEGRIQEEISKNTPYLANVIREEISRLSPIQKLNEIYQNIWHLKNEQGVISFNDLYVEDEVKVNLAQIREKNTTRIKTEEQSQLYQAVLDLYQAYGNICNILDKRTPTVGHNTLVGLNYKVVNLVGWNDARKPELNERSFGWLFSHIIWPAERKLSVQLTEDAA